MDDLNLPRCWTLAMHAVKHAHRTLLWGLPGLGKSHAAIESGPEVFRVYLHEEMPAAELRGYERIKNGTMKWSHGVAVQAWLLGRPLLLDEIQAASGDCLTFCRCLLDDPEVAMLTLPTGETVKPTKGFRVIATSNDPPDSLPAPLMDRFDAIIEIDQPNPAAIMSLPPDLREAARKSGACEEIERRISLRRWKAFANFRTKMDAKDAAEIVFGARATDILSGLVIGNAAR